MVDALYRVIAESSYVREIIYRVRVLDTSLRTVYSVQQLFSELYCEGNPLLVVLEGAKAPL